MPLHAGFWQKQPVPDDGHALRERFEVPSQGKQHVPQRLAQLVVSAWRLLLLLLLDTAWVGHLRFRTYLSTQRGHVGCQITVAWLREQRCRHLRTAHAVKARVSVSASSHSGEAIHWCAMRHRPGQAQPPCINVHRPKQQAGTLQKHAFCTNGAPVSAL